MKSPFYKSLVILIFLVFFSVLSFANTVLYLSPLPDSKYNMEKTNIIIGYSEKLNKSIVNSTSILVTGSISGVHKGKIILAENDTKILFVPDIPFALGEKVTVSGLKNVNEFSFFIRATKPALPDNYYRDVILANELKNAPFVRDFHVSPDSLPAFTIYNSGQTANGYLFISNFGNGFLNSILMMLENSGAPHFARTLQFRAFDFKKQNENLLTYYYEIGAKFFGLNSSYSIVDSFFCGNGYSTNFHELTVTPDGGAYVMNYDPQYVDMSLIVPGGKTNALVTGLIIQKINAQKNVVFQWRSWDHFQITDATHENLTASSIDYVHGNAIEVDFDNNIIISCRHMDEITKINSTTGNIIWRLGGKNNQFFFHNDTIRFSYQHSSRRVPNGNLILFDNGNYHTPQFSRAIEYELDENEKTATLVWEYRHTPTIYSSAMGNVQRLSNGNTLIGWGTASTTLTEVTPNGNIAYELSLPYGQYSYRAFRFEWGTMTGIKKENTLPDKYILYQNYPNPFNPSTIIKYQIPKSGFVTLKIFDIAGKEIATLVNEFKSAGTYEKQFSRNLINSNLSSGVYFYRIQTGDFSDTKKLILIK